MVGRVAEQLYAELAQVLGDLAIEFEDQSSTESTLRSIVAGAVGIVPGARWAGVSLIQGREVNSRAPSEELVDELDKIQTAVKEGPYLSALRENHTVHIDDMAAETRWPRFAGAAMERGVRSLLSFRLFVRRGSLGALNLYGDDAGVFNNDSVLIGEVLAQHASVAMVGAAAESQFQTALASRVNIGQAKGILMHRSNVTGLHVFRMLVGASQKTNIKLVDVARWVIEEHESGLNR
jgi:hypothetical protein